MTIPSHLRTSKTAKFPSCDGFSSMVPNGLETHVTFRYYGYVTLSFDVVDPSSDWVSLPIICLGDTLDLFPKLIRHVNSVLSASKIRPKIGRSSSLGHQGCTLDIMYTPSPLANGKLPFATRTHSQTDFSCLSPYRYLVRAVRPDTDEIFLLLTETSMKCFRDFLTDAHETVKNLRSSGSISATAVVW